MSRLIEYDKPYRLRAPHDGLLIGTICYRLSMWDYGVAGDDSRRYGTDHISMTLDPRGNYPGFTVPTYLLEEACLS